MTGALWLYMAFILFVVMSYRRTDVSQLAANRCWFELPNLTDWMQSFGQLDSLNSFVVSESVIFGGSARRPAFGSGSGSGSVQMDKPAAREQLLAPGEGEWWRAPGSPRLWRPPVRQTGSAASSRSSGTLPRGGWPVLASLLDRAEATLTG